MESTRKEAYTHGLPKMIWSSSRTSAEGHCESSWFQWHTECKRQSVERATPKHDRASETHVWIGNSLSLHFRVQCCWYETSSGGKVQIYEQSDSSHVPFASHPGGALHRRFPRARHKLSHYRILCKFMKLKPSRKCGERASSMPYQ